MRPTCIGLDDARVQVLRTHHPSHINVQGEVPFCTCNRSTLFNFNLPFSFAWRAIPPPPHLHTSVQGPMGVDM